MKKLLFIAFISQFILSCSPTKNALITPISKVEVSEKGVSEMPKKRPKNIILLIGDGMGLSQVTASYYTQNGKSNFLQFPVVGLHINNPAEDSTIITDSAAGATAFSTGEKSYNAAIGVGADSLFRKTILEEAEEHNLATGLVATCSVQHATPAAFVAHVKKRDNFEEISEWFLKTEVDLVIGGGIKAFKNRKKDDRDLLNEMEKKGYFVTDWTKQDLEKTTFPTDKNCVFMTANEHPLQANQGRDYLPMASQKACEFLKARNSKGFFMMIEGSQIDWGGHAGSSDYIIGEMLDFDKAIGKVLDFAKADGNTLVIVTADHETGGYALVKGSKMAKVVGSFGDTKPDSKGSLYHTAAFIPVFAFGPGAEQFSGIYQNTDIHKKMKLLFGF